jgi:hypothetical protein
MTHSKLVTEYTISQLPGPKCFRKVFTAHIHRIVNGFVTTGSAEKSKSSGRPKVIEEVVENIRDQLEEDPKGSLTRMFLQTGVPRSTCHKIVLKNLHLHPYKVPTVQELLP